MPRLRGSRSAILTLALTGCLIVSAAQAGPSEAAERAEKAAQADNTLVIPTDNASVHEEFLPTKVVKESHGYLERKLLELTIRFDDFFGSVKTEHVRRYDYLLRWQNSLRWDEGGRLKYRTSARASFRLPGINERLNLLITGETEAEPSARLPDDPGNPGFDRTLPNTRLVNTELRYGVIRKPDVDLFLGAGVRLVLPPDAFVRSRFQYTRRIGDAALARFGETLFWKDSLGFGETTEIDLERQLAPRTLIRWANSGTVAQKSDGLVWGTELSLLHQFSPRSAITFAGGIFGDTDPRAEVETYRVLARYRRNVLTKWLFLELEPEISWPRNPDGAYISAYALTFRAEVVFQGAAAVKKEPGSKSP